MTVAEVEQVEDFDVQELIRDVVDSSGLTDPGEIAATVLAKIADEDLRAVLRSVLRRVVADTLRNRRHTSTDGARVGVSRANQVRDWYERTLMVSLHVGESDGRPLWARFGDCTAVELAFVVGERRELARQNAAQAKVYENVLARMKTKRVKVVRDLPAEDLREAMAS